MAQHFMQSLLPTGELTFLFIRPGYYPRTALPRSLNLQLLLLRSWTRWASKDRERRKIKKRRVRKEEKSQDCNLRRNKESRENPEKMGGIHRPFFQRAMTSLEPLPPDIYSFFFLFSFSSTLLQFLTESLLFFSPSLSLALFLSHIVFHPFWYNHLFYEPCIIYEHTMHRFS